MSQGYQRTGFTLIEILIVVVILGILAGIVVPLFQDASEQTRRTAFITDGRAFSRAAQRFRLETGDYLEDASSGTIPQGFDTYVRVNDWEDGTPLGGVWDAELNSFGITSALGVHFDGTGATQDDAYMVQVDEAIDDGNLASGAFQKLANDRYYFVIED